MDVKLQPTDLRILAKAFFEVLSKLPDDHLEKFFTEQPKLICNSNHGKVCHYVMPIPSFTPPDRQLHLTIIFLRHDIIKRKTLKDILAHEVAHVVRGDHRIGGVPKAHEYEKAADDLSRSWGFKGCYSKAMLDRMKKS